MKKFIQLIISVMTILVLSALAIGCGGQETASQNPTTIANKTYANTDYNFSVEYPADWDAKENLTEQEKDTGVVAVFEGPSSPEYDLRVQITLEAENLGGETTAEGYATGVEEYILKKNLANYTNIEEQETTIVGLHAVIRVFTSTTSRAMFKYTQAYFTKKEIGYVITYAATTDIYDTYFNIYNLVKNSFRFN